MDSRRSQPEIAVGRAVDALGSLPVLSGTVTRVIALADDPESSTGELVAVMESDEAFAVNLLRFANSAHNARPVRAATIRQAVTMVGRAAVKRLALEAATYRFLSQVPGNGGPSRGHMHVHAVAVGATAAVVAERAGAGIDVPHLAGLLHDVGKLVMPMAFGEQAAEEVALVAPAGAARVLAERERFGIDHAAAGGLLARRWVLPPDVAEAIRLHHGGSDNSAAPTREVACVQLANAMVEMVDGAVPDQALMSRAMTRLGFVAEQLDELAEQALSGRGVPTARGLGDEVARLEELAAVDDLTGVLNRRAWLAHARERVAQGERGAALVCDVDNFGAVNERHGHRMGDLVLVEVSRVLSQHGTTGRVGGDAFAVWVPQGVAGAQRAAAVTNAVLSESLGESSGLGEVGVSMTVVEFPEGADPADVLADAQARLGGPGPAST